MKLSGYAIENELIYNKYHISAISGVSKVGFLPNPTSSSPPFLSHPGFSMVWQSRVCCVIQNGTLWIARRCQFRNSTWFGTEFWCLLADLQYFVWLCGTLKLGHRRAKTKERTCLPATFVYGNPGLLTHEELMGLHNHEETMPKDCSGRTE